MNINKLNIFFYWKNSHLQEIKIGVKFIEMIENMCLIELKAGCGCRYLLAVKDMLCKKF